jgi:hypothetical protein
MSDTDNILSYFIKDIKDGNESGFYRQTNYNSSKIIWYKNKAIFEINSINIYKYIFNIYKSRSIINNIKSNYKISCNLNYKHLYYNHDKKLLYFNSNYIYYWFIYKKYLVKADFEYIFNNFMLFVFKVKFYKGYKYIFKPYRSKYKYTTNIILIMNKYELYYYNKFFNLYFGLLK